MGYWDPYGRTRKDYELIGRDYWRAAREDYWKDHPKYSGGVSLPGVGYDLGDYFTGGMTDPQDYRDLYDEGQYAPDPSDILGAFLTTPEGIVDVGKWAAEYGAYIDPYDISQQKLVEKQYAAQKEELIGTSIPIAEKMYSGVGRTGFSGGYGNALVDDYYRKLGIKSELIDVSEQGDIQDYHSNYMNNIYDMIVRLAGMGAFNELEDYIYDSPQSSSPGFVLPCPPGEQGDICRDMMGDAEINMADWIEEMQGGIWPETLTEMGALGSGTVTPGNMSAFDKWAGGFIKGLIPGFGLVEYIEKISQEGYKNTSPLDKFRDFVGSGFGSYIPGGGAPNMILQFINSIIPDPAEEEQQIPLEEEIPPGEGEEGSTGSWEDVDTEAYEDALYDAQQDWEQEQSGDVEEDWTDEEYPEEEQEDYEAEEEIPPGEGEQGGDEEYDWDYPEETEDVEDIEEEEEEIIPIIAEEQWDPSDEYAGSMS